MAALGENLRCHICGEEYTEQDIKDLREMGEQFYRGDDCFICPDCYDKYSRSSLEEQVDILFADSVPIRR